MPDIFFQHHTTLMDVWIFQKSSRSVFNRSLQGSQVWMDILFESSWSVVLNLSSSFFSNLETKNVVLTYIQFSRTTPCLIDVPLLPVCCSFLLTRNMFYLEIWSTLLCETNFLEGKLVRISSFESTYFLFNAANNVRVKVWPSSSFCLCSLEVP